MTALALAQAGLSLLGGVNAQSAANRAAAAQQRIGEYNASIIERDINLLENQRTIINNNALISNTRKRVQFREVQGDVVANFAYAGIDIAQGTPMQVLRENARELEYEITVDKFNNYVTNMQINDQQEDTKLTAQMSRMEAGAGAAAMRAQGSASLITSFGEATKMAYSSGIFTPTTAPTRYDRPQVRPF
tara:strand:- start:4729 stop:5298 length:570 start_codon:yes stop_codon:yes gene_type:complete